MLDNAEMARLFPGNGVGNSIPSWIAPPPGFLYIDPNATTSVAAGSGATLLTRILLTESYEGWLVKAGIFASSYTDFHFSILQGGAPVRNYQNIRVPLGQSDQLDVIGPIRIAPNEPLELYANAGAGAPPNVGIRYRLYGWYYKPHPGARL
jgi:hypothetical protein